MDIQVEFGSEIRKGRIRYMSQKLAPCWFCWVLLYLATSSVATFGQNQRPPNSRPASAQNQVNNQASIPLLLRMQIKDGKVNASVRAAPLQKVLEELAARSGIVFQIQSQDNPLVSIVLQEISLQEAVQRIASADDLIFYQGQDASSQNTIQLVKIYPRGEVPLQPSIRFIGSGAITKMGEDTAEGTE
jgi:hypothetical protein